MSSNNKKLNILIANGVNLDLLGAREKDHYGTFSLEDLQNFLSKEAKKIKELDLSLEFYQTNDESKFLDKLSSKTWDGIVMNSGAWTHTSIAIADRLAALKIPFVEVHISNIATREDFRHRSFTAPLSSGVVYGFGINSYLVGLLGLIRCLIDNFSKK